MSLSPEFRTERLLLRRLQRSDKESLSFYRSIPAVARFQSWESFGPEDACKLIEQQTGLEFGAPGTWFQLGIVEAKSGRIIGDCGLHFLEEDKNQVELGITLDSRYQSQGIATEAFECLLKYFFEREKKHRLFAITDAENQAAENLLTKLGFRKEGHFIDHVWFKGAYGSEYLFALLRREWEAAQ